MGVLFEHSVVLALYQMLPIFNFDSLEVKVFDYLQRSFFKVWVVNYFSPVVFVREQRPYSDGYSDVLAVLDVITHLSGF